MPAVVTMENGGQAGARSDHGPDPKPNGVNGLTEGPVKDASAATHGGPSGETGGAGSSAHKHERPLEIRPPRMNDLPDEIMHITEGFVPLSRLLSRLAQKTHNELQEKIAELAKMPLPAGDEGSMESLRKKSALLGFAQETHGKWVKALVISEWSRKADMVSKLIDLKCHIDGKRMLYETMLDQMVHVKRDLTYARMPSPDLKTALQILSTGSAPWMPDLQYIEPPPLDADDQLKWLDDLNTLLSLRLNLDEFDKIPPQFKNYDIDSGRVTFKVDGEFEVDLTIADEDFEKQFWFIDFRFSYSPSSAGISEALRGYLEGCVNEALSKDGLTGCYKFLHEFVLTCKINELKRQAMQLSKALWTGTLKVEPLHRALAIHYWTSRAPLANLKSWVLIAVNSGSKQKTGTADKQTSFLEIKWYRENKAVADFDLAVDFQNLSVESLLQRVIGSHIEVILRGIHDKLLATTRFKMGEHRVSLDISSNNPADSRLTVQVAHSTNVSLMMEPKTGLFVMKPSSRLTVPPEHKLNNGANLVEGGFMCLEDVRCAYMEDEITKRSVPLGWSTVRPALKDDEVKHMTKLREWARTIWLHRKGWPEHWSLVAVLSTHGDEWWLVETNPQITNRAHKFQLKVPLAKGPLNFSEQFWHNLTVLCTSMISQSMDTRELFRQHIKHRHGERVSAPGKQMRIPPIDIALSALFPSMVCETEPSKNLLQTSNLGNPAQTPTPPKAPVATGLSARQPWAKDIITLRFKTAQGPWRDANVPNLEHGDRLVCISEAIIKVRDPSKLASLEGRVDRAVHYDSANGEFHLRIRHHLGEPILHNLKSRIMAIDRFVCFLEALEKSKGTIEKDKTSLRVVSFFYGQKPPSSKTEGEATTTTESAAQKWRVELDFYNPVVDLRLDQNNPHLRVLDLLKHLVNTDGGIRALMERLPMTLPTMNVLDTIESGWDSISTQGKGNVTFTFKLMDWMDISYAIQGTTSAGQPVTRRLNLTADIQQHKDESYWFIKRSDWTAPSETFNTALQTIFTGRGEGWQGLGSGAAGKVAGAGGMATLLEKIDEVIKPLVGTLNGDEGFPPPPPQPQPVNPAPQQGQPQPGQTPQQPQAPQPQTQSAQKKKNPPKNQPKSGKAPEQAIEIA